MCLRTELTTKTAYAGRLEYLLHERMNRVDELTAQVVHFGEA